MVKQPKTAGRATARHTKAGSDDRLQRLEAALRENLKRRKVQSRARAEPIKDPSKEPAKKQNPDS